MNILNNYLLCKNNQWNKRREKRLGKLSNKIKMKACLSLIKINNLLQKRKILMKRN